MDTSQSDLAMAIHGFLERAKKAHGRYEAEDLGGVYDEEWARWYAEHIIASGLPSLLGEDSPESEELAQLLTEADADHRANAPDEDWMRYYSAFLAERLQDWNR